MPEPSGENPGANAGAEENLERLLKGMTDSWLLRSAEQTEALAADLVSAVAEHAKANPSPDESIEADLEQQARMGRWEEVIALREQLIERCRERGEFHQVFRHERDLAALLQHLQRPSEALLHAREATMAARQVDGTPVLVGLGLQVELVCGMQCGEFREALNCADRSLEAIGTEDYARLLRGDLLVCRAECLLSLDEIIAAEADLEAAAECLGIHSDCPDLAGVQSRRAGWYEAQALCCTKRGEKSSAVEWIIRAMELRQYAASHPLAGHFHGVAGLAGCYHQLAAAYADLGASSEGASARQTRNQLRALLKLPILPD
jgi:tetratricopeptide (TPR) repeat protein